MKPNERRNANAYPYFKLATWDSLSLTWKDGKVAIESEQAARNQAKRPGKYRVSRVEESGRVDLPPFEIPAK